VRLRRRSARATLAWILIVMTLALTGFAFKLNTDSPKLARLLQLVDGRYFQPKHERLADVLDRDPEVAAEALGHALGQQKKYVSQHDSSSQNLLFIQMDLRDYLIEAWIRKHGSTNDLGAQETLYRIALKYLDGSRDAEIERRFGVKSGSLPSVLGPVFDPTWSPGGEPAPAGSHDKQPPLELLDEVFPARPPQTVSAPDMTVLEQFFLAIGQDRVSEVRALLAEGVSPNQQAPGEVSDITPLMSAESARMVSLLLEAGADINAVDRDGATALHHAVLKDQALEMVPLLLPAAPIDARRADTGETPLMVARQWFFGMDATRGRKVIELLLAAGADINARDGRGDTLLQVAAGNDQAGLVCLLLQKKADRSIRNADGRTALDIARDLGFREIVGLLSATNPAK
jgi:uncharacterized protein